IKAVYNPPKGIELGQTEAIDETKNLSSRVIQTRQAILANDWSAVARDYAKSSIDTLAILNVPMAVQDKVIGTIEIHSFTKTHAFDENDRYSLSLLASQAATAIERTQLLNQLENNRHFLKTIIDHIPDPIFIKDRKHTWLEMNQANTHVLGQPAHELVGKSDKHFFSNELSDEFYRRDNEVFTKNQILEHEDKTVWGDGQEHIAYTRLIPISGTSGEPEYLLGITHDITERKAHEAEREQFLAETSALYEGSQSISSALS
ncbi:MAG: PAS domain-containing protein, partial [Deltaproteobacteria bacterium]|nr:PAS domain-containing protein [Deltaproteobacteria bacterium]